ncbi:MAG: DUF2207 domain-containing protein [Candidatus Micrarchaeia archaeon]
MKRILLLVLVICAVVTAKDYSIVSADEKITIKDNGIVHITETINYDLYDCNDNKFKELYLTKPRDLEIRNARGYCIGALCNFRVDEPEVSVSGDRELINELVGGGCGKVTAVFEYDVKAITIYPDTSQFYYKVWGDKWEKPAKLSVSIYLPGKAKETVYFVHYDYFTFTPPTNSSSGNIISISADQPANRLLEINLLMPKEWFNENGDYYYNNNTRKKDIISIEERTMSALSIKRFVDILLLILFVVFITIPFAAIIISYLIFGKELSGEDVGYNGLYEYDPPENRGAAESIFFITMDKDCTKKDLGNALSSTMMALVNKGAFDIQEREVSGLFGKTKEIVFIVREPKEELLDYEKMLFDFMKEKAVNGEISMDSFAKTVGKTKEFYFFSLKWWKTVINHIDENKFADYKGYYILMAIILIHFFLYFFAIVLFSSINTVIPINLFALIDFFLLIIVTPRKKIWGRWTKEGRILNLKWENFKKYLSDFSALEEHPPSSVKIWDHYMTYAIALGVAEKTIEAMKKISPLVVQHSRGNYVYANYGLYTSFSTSMTPSYKSSSRGGRSGGFGGGRGGGGGGAR